jgi:hypothetical protein
VALTEHFIDDDASNASSCGNDQQSHRANGR